MRTIDICLILGITVNLVTTFLCIKAALAHKYKSINTTSGMPVSYWTFFV